MDLKDLIRAVPDFPKPGILFRDVTPLLADAQAFRDVVEQLAAPFRGKVDMVVGIESRGFIFGAPTAYALGCGLAVVRKPGKLPAATFAAEYALEYGVDRLEIHRDGLPSGCRALIVDDLLATGGTAEAAARLVTQLGGQVVSCAFVIELAALGGREKLRPHPVHALLAY